MRDQIAEHYEALAGQRDHYLRMNQYYYSQLYNEYKYFIPKGKRILEVGCSTGELLNVLEPSYGVGVDLSPQTIGMAKSKYPQLKFYAGNITAIKTSEKFDYIVLSGTLGETEDIQGLFESLRPLCTNDTRIIIEYYSYFWQYMLKIAEWLHMKIPQKIQNWLVYHDIENLLNLSGFETVKRERSILFPKNIIGLSYLLNRFIGKLPIINALTLTHFIIARPIFSEEKEYTVTILVPCRNERGNIEQAILRTPVFGKSQEFIFVEGVSSDGTYEEVERIIKRFPEKDIKLYKQIGKGKGDAVRTGFKQAQGDVLMILDADLTMPPEELPKFYEAIRSGKGEFINGCRLVYPMEKESMRFLNLIANKFFSLFFSWLLGQRYRDTLCGTKVMFRRHYEELVKNRHYFGDFDPFGDFDLIFGANKLNLKAVDLPVHYKERKYGTTQIQRFRHGLLLIKMCWFAMRKIKFR